MAFWYNPNFAHCYKNKLWFTECMQPFAVRQRNNYIANCCKCLSEVISNNILKAAFNVCVTFLPPQCVARKGFASGLSGSDVCHFCTKRVYVMERLSAEGYFFHRECFRCDECKCTLRLGGHSFDSQEGTFDLLYLHMLSPQKFGGIILLLETFNVLRSTFFNFTCVWIDCFCVFFTAKFYCKMHYAQRQSSIRIGKFRRRTVRTETWKTVMMSEAMIYIHISAKVLQM